jgi:hypothetical protein
MIRSVKKRSSTHDNVGNSKSANKVLHFNHYGYLIRELNAMRYRPLVDCIERMESHRCSCANSFTRYLMRVCAVMSFSDSFSPITYFGKACGSDAQEMTSESSNDDTDSTSPECAPVPRCGCLKPVRKSTVFSNSRPASVKPR